MTKGLPLEIACVTLVCESTEAACTWTWDCSTGTCRQIPVCDSTLDLPPPRPPGIAPVSAPSIKPLTASGDRHQRSHGGRLYLHASRSWAEGPRLRVDPLIVAHHPLSHRGSSRMGDEAAKEKRAPATPVAVGAQFSNVDASGDPAALVRYLDDTAQ